jgi:hypothetical protein
MTIHRSTDRLGMCCDHVRACGHYATDPSCSAPGMIATTSQNCTRTLLWDLLQLRAPEHYAEATRKPYAFVTCPLVMHRQALGCGHAWCCTQSGRRCRCGTWVEALP